MRRRLLRYLVPALAGLVGSSAVAGETRPLAPGWMLDTWGAADGIPAGGLTDLEVDAAGLVWGTTYDGLVRFDGNAVTVLRSGEALGPRSNRLIFVGVHPGDGALWLRDEAGGLQRRAQPPFTSWAPEEHLVTSGFSYGEQDLWVAGDGQLLRLGEAPEVVDTPAASVVFPVAGPGGALWVLDGNRGLWHGEEGSDQWSAVALPDASWTTELRRSLESGDLVLVHEDGSVTAWSEADGGFVPLDPGAASPVNRAPAPSDWRWGLGELVFRGAHLAPGEPLVVGPMRGEGPWWFKGVGGSLNRLRQTPLQTWSAPEGDSGNVQRLWWQAGAEVLWAQDEVLGWWPVLYEGDRPPAALPAPAASDACPPWTLRYFEDDQGTLWLSCQDRVLRREAGAWVSDPPPGRARSGPAWHTRRGVVLGGERSTLAILQEGAWIPVVQDNGDPLEDVYALVEGEEGDLLVGNFRGLWQVEGGASVARRVDREAVGGVRHLRRDGEHVWVSTVDHGLCVLPRDGLDGSELRCLGAASALARGTVHATLADGRGRTYLSTNEGIGVLSTEALDAWAAGGPEPMPWWLGTRHGMATAEANGFVGDAALVSPDGRLWFATQRGVVVIDPESLELPASPEVLILAARVGEESASLPVSLDLPTEHAPVRLEWTTPAVVDAEQVQFRYRLGEGSAWSRPSAARSLDIPTLAPGPSLLQVQARLGTAWGPVASLPLSRAPALHERGVFPLLLGLALTALVGVLLGLRSRWLAALNRDLEVRVAVQTEELAHRAANLGQMNETLEVRNQALASQSELLAERAARISEQARKLSELDELKRQLIANVSHELRTPLSLIMGPLSTLLAEADEGSKLRRHLALAIDNAQRLDVLIGQLFELSRVQADGGRLRARRIDLAGLVRDAGQRFEGLATERGVALVVEGAEHPALAWVERDRIDKVLSNLLANALRFCPVGSTLRLGLEADEDQLLVSVEDEGPGVPVAQREAVFDRFFQIDGAGQGGAGLGLALARELVELHGGRIAVEDGAVGARFWFSLPMGVAHLAPHEIDSGDLAPAVAALEPLAEGELRGSLLLVEDHPQLRAYLREVLSTRFKVTEAADGAEALAILGAEDAPVVDLVVSDVMMPRVDGLELARRLRADPAFAHLPILFMSARQELDDRLEGLGVADDYLAKPFYAPELLARVEALLRRASGAVAVDLPEPGAPSEAERLLDRLLAVAEPRLADPDFNSGSLAKAMAMSPRTLQGRMQALGLPQPNEWLREARLARAQALMARGELVTVGEIAAAVGFSRSYFSRLYRAHTGRTAKEDLVG